MAGNNLVIFGGSGDLAHRKLVPALYNLAVRGLLPYVSNLGADPHFGAVFETEDAPRRFVMAIVPCAAEGVTLSGSTKFVAPRRESGNSIRQVHHEES